MATVELRQYGTLELIRYGAYQPGTHTVALRINGNSILSTLFVSTIEVGASVRVQYYEERQGIRRDLQANVLMEAGTSAIIVGPHQETLKVDIIVSNGAASFTCIATARNDQPFDMLALAHIDGESEFTDDPGLAVRTIEMGPLVRADYDEIVAVEVDSLTENFVYKLAGDDVATLQFKFRSDGSFESVKRL